jgi:hypothetical protein
MYEIVERECIENPRVGVVYYAYYACTLGKIHVGVPVILKIR